MSQCRAIEARVGVAWNDREIAAIFERHTHVTAVLPGVRRRNWSTDDGETCVVVFVWLKGYMPACEEPLPSRICGLPVDVREASCSPLGSAASAWIHLGQDQMVFPGSSLGGLPNDAGSVGAVLAHNGVFFALTAAHCVGEVGAEVRFPSEVDILPFLKAKSIGSVHWRCYACREVANVAYSLDAALVKVDANAVFKCDTALLVPAHANYTRGLSDAMYSSSSTGDVDAATTSADADSAASEPEPFVVGPLLSYGELREDDRFVMFGRSSGAVFEDGGLSIALVWARGAVRDGHNSGALWSSVETADRDGILQNTPFYTNQLIFMFADSSGMPRSCVKHSDSGSVVFAIRDRKLRPVALVHRAVKSDSIDFAVATPIEVVLASANADMNAAFSFTLE